MSIDHRSIDQARWSINPLIDEALKLVDRSMAIPAGDWVFNFQTSLGESFSPSARKASLTDAVGHPPRTLAQ
jgi:hypothetical protein